MHSADILDLGPRMDLTIVWLFLLVWVFGVEVSTRDVLVGSKGCVLSELTLSVSVLTAATLTLCVIMFISQSVFDTKQHPFERRWWNNNSNPWTWGTILDCVLGDEGCSDTPCKIFVGTLEKYNFNLWVRACRSEETHVARLWSHIWWARTVLGDTSGICVHDRVPCVQTR